MVRYKTKPCEIEAIQYTGNNLIEILDFLFCLQKGRSKKKMKKNENNKPKNNEKIKYTNSKRN